MTMSPRLRKLALTAHVLSSVGWFGAVAVFLALAIAGLNSRDTQIVRAAYVAMDLTATFIIVPFNFASLLTGLVMSLGTTWGLFRHYWVLVKFIITILSTIVLQVHLQIISYMASAVEDTTFLSGDLTRQQVQLVVAAGAALLVLLVNTSLTLYKPRGMTPYGWHKKYKKRTESHP